MPLTLGMDAPWKAWLQREVRFALDELTGAARADAYRKRYPSAEACLVDVPWEAIIMEHMYDRIPLAWMMKQGVPDFATCKHAASEYLTTHPTSVACAIEGAVAEHGDDAVIDHVMERLVPPLLPWAREVKGFALSDFETPVYPTPLKPND